jgi:hypothetical protein
MPDWKGSVDSWCLLNFLRSPAFYSGSLVNLPVGTDVIIPVELNVIIFP